jgi:hypothetical protein
MRVLVMLGPIAGLGLAGTAGVYAGGRPTPPEPAEFFVALGAFAFVLLVLLAATWSGLRRSPGPASRDPRRAGPRRS